MDETRNEKRRGAPFLLIIPGCLLIGLSIGIMVAEPAIGATGGLGVGMLLWGLILSFRA